MTRNKVATERKAYPITLSTEELQQIQDLADFWGLADRSSTLRMILKTVHYGIFHQNQQLMVIPRDLDQHADADTNQIAEGDG